MKRPFDATISYWWQNEQGMFSLTTCWSIKTWICVSMAHKRWIPHIRNFIAATTVTKREYKRHKTKRCHDLYRQVPLKQKPRCPDDKMIPQCEIYYCHLFPWRTVFNESLGLRNQRIKKKSCKATRSDLRSLSENYNIVPNSEHFLTYLYVCNLRNIT